MNKHLKLILSTFTKQRHPNDCGMACLESILKYAGLKVPRQDLDFSQQISLLQLHKVASVAGLSSACVKMDVGGLNATPSPCILHTINDAGQPHFIVHYPCRLGSDLHLIGDPNRKPELVTEEELLKRWVSRAALYIEDVTPKFAGSYLFFPWNAFAEFRLIPRVLWLSIPLLHLLAVFLGLAVALVIQKAIEPGFINSKQGFFILLFILLVLISLAKCFLNYLRQWMLISAGLKMDSKLASIFLNNAYQTFKAAQKNAAQFYLKTISDVQKIHHAIALLVGVVISDGLLIMVMFGGLFYYQPELIFIQLAVFAGMALVIDRYLPLLMIYYGSISISMYETGELPAESSNHPLDLIDYRSFSERYDEVGSGVTKKVKCLSEVANKINLSFEAIGAISMIIVLFFLFYKLQANLISYKAFLMTIILCYNMVVQMSKICHQLLTIAQGADVLRQNVALGMNGNEPR